MNLHQQLQISREAYLRTKRDYCRDFAGPYDLQHQLTVIDDEGHYSLGIVESVDLIPMAVRSLEESLPGVAAFVVSMADALHAEVPEGEQARPGTLARRLNEGDPTVHDALAFTALDVLTNEALGSMITYHYDDFGQPVFDTPVEVEAIAGASAVLDNIRDALGLSNA